MRITKERRWIWLTRRRRIDITLDHNFNTKGLRGCALLVTPLIRWFPTGAGYHRDFPTLHLGWLYWTFVIHFYRRND